MRVRAKALGYYGDIRRREGDIFKLETRTVGDKDHRRTSTVEQQFSPIWMEQVDESGNVIGKKVAAHSKPEVEIETERPMDRPVTEERKPEKAPSKSSKRK